MYIRNRNCRKYQILLSIKTFSCMKMAERNFIDHLLFIGTEIINFTRISHHLKCVFLRYLPLAMKNYIMIMPDVCLRKETHKVNIATHIKYL